MTTRNTVLTICGILVIGILYWAAAESWSRPTPPSMALADAGAPPIVVPKETNLVVSFYEALLQEKAPSLQQEKELFGEQSSLRTNLIEMQGYKASSPVILQLCRKHKDLFLPKNTQDVRAAVQVSSPFSFVRNLARAKDSVPGCNVMVLFVEDARVQPHRLRTIVFPIENDKIDADGIELKGFEGADTDMLLGRFLKMPGNR
ncbi:MAG: hypothetical protein WD042_10125 [Phycisphaeraceae bacterium]